MLFKVQSTKINKLNIIYEQFDSSLLMGFSGLNCILFDKVRQATLLSVNTKGGNRPIKTAFVKENEKDWYPQIIYAYGDCISVARGTQNEVGESQNLIKVTNLIPPIHGREILSVLGLNKGKTILVGSEDTTFKLFRRNTDN